MDKTLSRSRRRACPSWLPGVVAVLAFLCVAVVSLMVGSYVMTPAEVLSTLAGNGTKLQNFAVLQTRLPRTVLAVIVGTALAFSGAILQGVTRNPLAEPGMIGINAGAALAVVLWIGAQTSAYYSQLDMFTTVGMPVVAAVGALLSTALVYLLSYNHGIRPVRFILTGIGVNGGITAIITYYQLAMSQGSYSQVLTWTNGSLWGSSWGYIALVGPLVGVLVAVTLAKARTLDALRLGDELACGIGVNVNRQRVLFIVLAALLAALATAVAGSIAFLGLLGPQIAKRLVGCRASRMLPMSACVSSVILVLADTVARNAFSPIEIPVGVVVAVIGVPYFVYLMIKEK
jgi:iron complex transport system permease protein